MYSRLKHLSKYPGIIHFVSTRTGGVSPPPFDSLNLGFGTKDQPSRVLKNRQILAEAVGVPLANFTLGKQVHGDNIAVVTSELRGRGSHDYENALDATDGLVTDVPGTCLMVLLADCVPLLFYDPVHKAIGAVHAGWKGTVRQIGRRAVDTMAEHYGSRPGDIVVGIGPSIGPCCYEVGPEVIAQAEESFGETVGLVDGNGHLNLWEANLRQLLEAGIPEANIEVAGICTRCNADRFFSERKQPGTGRFGVGIMLVE